MLAVVVIEKGGVGRKMCGLTMLIVDEMLRVDCLSWGTGNVL